MLLGKGCLLYSLVLNYERSPLLREVRPSFDYILDQICSGLSVCSTIPPSPPLRGEGLGVRGKSVPRFPPLPRCGGEGLGVRGKSVSRCPLSNGQAPVIWLRGAGKSRATHSNESAIICSTMAPCSTTLTRPAWSTICVRRRASRHTEQAVATPSSWETCS